MILAFRLAEELHTPVMVSYDGFYLSHTYEAVNIPSQEVIDQFLPNPRSQALFDLNAPVNHHGIVGSEAMSQLMQTRFKAMARVRDRYELLNTQYAGITRRNYPAVEYSGPENAKTLFVTAGGMAQTIKSFLSSPERDEALVRIKMFRPFPVEDIHRYLAQSHVERIIIVDRNVCMGVGGIFAQEVKAALAGLSGLPELVELNLAGGLDLTPDLLKKALLAVHEGEKMIWAVNLL